MNNEKREKNPLRNAFGRFLTRLGIGMRAKLIIIFLFETVVPLVILTAIASQQIVALGDELRRIAVEDSSAALNDSAVENIERMTTDTARAVADFLYARDDDLLYLASIEPTHENYRLFSDGKTGRVLEAGSWALAADGGAWQRTDAPPPATGGGLSTNEENNDMDGFHYRQPETYTYSDLPLYDEITFVGLDGMEQVKYVAPGSSKTNYPMNSRLRDVSDRAGTYIRAETYFEALQGMEPGEIYVSDVIGAYTRSNYIGMYTPDNVAAAAADRGYDIDYNPEAQAYAGKENPNGQRFEGIVRWATPVAGQDGEVAGYVTFALNHDHIMEFVDHITPMKERYTDLPSAYEGNYAFIWDYQSRSICHPRHHSIVGFNPETGQREVPWLESSIYDAWQQSGVEDWNEFIVGWPTFDNQSRDKIPAPALTQAGYVGLDGRYLNNAPQCTGWMDLTAEGGSGSFYILWSGLYKLTTAAAIPYYTGQYAPGEHNDFSERGFGFVAIGSGLEDFTRPATETEVKLTTAIENNQSDTTQKLVVSSVLIMVAVVLISILLATSLTRSITQLIAGISQFRAGRRQFRFDAPVKDEFGTLADAFDDMAQSIENSVKNPLTITDMTHKILYMNQYGLDFCGITLDQAVGSSYGDTSLYPGDTKYDPILALEEGRESEVYHDKKSGHYLRGVAGYLLDKNGAKIGYIIESTDMTEMVQEQIKIEEQRSLLDMIFSASPDLIWYMDADGRYVTVNPRFASISGSPVEGFVGKTASETLPAGLAATFGKNDDEAIHSGRPLYSEEQIDFADGHTETLDSARTPIYGPNGELVGLLGFARNITARVTMENQLRQTQLDLEQAVADANRANEHKGEFLARMSHEIRTPMNAIIGVTNMVQRKLEDAQQGADNLAEVASQVDQIEASSQHLLGLLNDILDISKIEAGKIELTEEPTDLLKLADTVYNIIKPRCDEKSIRFGRRFDDFNGAAFLTDPLRLRQVLINLLGNAVKFTPEFGAIDFGIQLLERGEGAAKVHFYVRDNGIGIPEENRVSIFQAFEQAKNNQPGQHGGTGLGLAISQRIVELFGGELSVDSTVGQGSDFKFTLWLKECETPEDEALVHDLTGSLEGYRMLLVDDVEINRIIVASLLEETGIEIVEAGDGVDAVEQFENSPPGWFNVILMDVQMPGMDGYQATEAIRAMDRPDAKTVPIVALTANAFKEDMDKALARGMNAHVAKPIETDMLMSVLFRLLKSGG